MSDTPRRSHHPAVAGREPEMTRLTLALRRLLDAAVTHETTPDETAEIAENLEAIAARLEAHVPVAPADRHIHSSPNDPPLPNDFSPFDVVIGEHSPLAAPLHLTWQSPGAVGHATFGEVHAGPPGCVHGGVLAGVLDRALVAATMARGIAGPTVELTVRYRKATPLHRRVEVEAWVDDDAVVDHDRDVVAAGRITLDGVVTAEATARFRSIDPQRLLDGLADR